MRPCDRGNAQSRISGRCELKRGRQAFGLSKATLLRVLARGQSWICNRSFLCIAKLLVSKRSSLCNVRFRLSDERFSVFSKVKLRRKNETDVNAPASGARMEESALMRPREISPKKAGRRRPLRVRYRHWAFKLPFVRNYRGMVIGRTILFKGDESEVSRTLFRHELIHQEQIEWHGIARFYLIYFRDYLSNLWRLRSHDAAYRNIPFEKEAFERQHETGQDDDRRM
jgi:hypothetical protein